MIQSTEIYSAKLKQHNLSNTVQRRAVFDALLNSNHQPLTMNELINVTANQCDRASVYRAVSALESASIIKRVHHGWKYRLELSEDFHGHHHHIICSKCGTIQAIHNPLKLEDTLNSLAQTLNYQLIEHTVELRGICPNCKSK